MSGVQDAVGVLDDFRDAASSGEGLRGRAARGICDAYAGSPILQGADTVTNRAGAVAMNYGCGPYWGGPDGYDPPSLPPDEPPFEGGQCAGDSYRVRVRRSTQPDTQSIWTPDFSPVTGPITSMTVSPQTPGQAVRTFTVVANGQTFSESRNIQISTETPFSLVPSIRNLTDVNDDCGDPPGVPQDPTPGNPGPGRPAYGDPFDVGEPGSPFPITVRPPTIGPDGAPVFPIDTPTGTEPFSPTDPDSELPPEPPAIGEPIDVQGGGEEEVPDEPEDERAVLLGYRWTVLGDENFQSVIPGSSPRVYSRVVGSIQLRLRGEGSSTFYGPSLRIDAKEGSIVNSNPALSVGGVAYTSLPNLGGLRLREIRGKRNDC